MNAMSYSFTNANIIGMPESHRAVIGIDMSPDVWLEGASNADDPVAMLRSKGEWQLVLADALEDLRQSAGPGATPVTDRSKLALLEDYPPGALICWLGTRVRPWKVRDARQSNYPIDTLRNFGDYAEMLADRIKWVENHTF